MQVPFLDLHLQAEETTEIQAAITRVVKSGWFILGNEVEAFEKQYAAFNEVKFCAGTSNGLDALRIALNALEIKPGDEVLVPSNTFIATVLAITQAGAVPVFVEPRLTTCNINPDLIEEKISSKSRAIIPVHLFGQSCEMESIMQIADKHNLQIVEDNAQAQGARFNGKLTGSFGSINATSFYPTKNIGALGDAGALTTNDQQLWIKAKQLRNYGSEKKYFNEVMGYNARLDEIQAAILSVKLSRLNKMNGKRKELAAKYRQLLSSIPEVVMQQMAPKAESVFHVLFIRSNRRNELQQFLSEHDITTMIHYPVPPHLQKAFEHFGYHRGDFPVAEELSDTGLSLPFFPSMSDDQLVYVCEKVKQFFSR